MSGITGIEMGGKKEVAEHMLSLIAHRGSEKKSIIERNSVTLGSIGFGKNGRSERGFADYSGKAPTADELKKESLPFAGAWMDGDALIIARDKVGVSPLYYGNDETGAFCFASEVKALMAATTDIHEFPPGHMYRSGLGFQSFASISEQKQLNDSSSTIAKTLRNKLETSVSTRVNGDTMGSWLSGGIDSSIIVALLRPLVKTLHTFAAGLPGAPDLEFAKVVAKHTGTTHHEVTISEHDLSKVLGEVIYALESFDALLVRSTIMNFLVSRVAKDYVDTVFSGEGGDELFAGYEYIKEIPIDLIPAELVDITNRLHNTALQRVDRSSMANGLVAHVPFLDGNVVDYAMSIPPQLKVLQGEFPIEKWILRKSMEGDLPESVLWRKKAKFWEGAGVEDFLSDYADKNVRDSDFRSERIVRADLKLNTKEELLYYRHFKEYFGSLPDLEWMGRTKGAPEAV
jgi:asparagine synthase (glutamine-hydrolysing)